MEQLFKPGQIVCLRADPKRSGSVIEMLVPIAGQPRYRVFHSPLDIREYRQEQLIAADHILNLSSTDVFVDAFTKRRWLDANMFLARLTASRLANPLTDNLYALHAARIQYVPFQFKPLVRFIRADQPRLLIADEVGVGKTIEAGLILKELQSRQQVDRVLVVCPKALVTKWQKEMRRFDEDFRILSGETLRYCLKESDLDGAWPLEYSRAIIHLELLRMDEYLSGVSGRCARPGLLTLDPPPHFGLVIVDEAHHLRTAGTRSHDLARFLCDTSEAVLFLSATPVHVGSTNLFTLLNLLRPDLFPDESAFDEVIEPNQHLTRTMRHVRTCAPQESWQTEATTALAQAGRTVWGQQTIAQDPRFAQWFERLGQAPLLSDSERVQCLRDMEELHSLAHVMNRTRRRDIGRFTIREPHTVSVFFTPQQQELYNALLNFRRQALLLEYDPQIVRLITDTLERQAASCLPGLMPTLDKVARTKQFSMRDLSDDTDTDDGVSDLPDHLIELANELRKLAINLPEDDPKLEQLIAIIQQTVAGSGPKKILVFSFFLHTLAYLEEKLQATGCRIALITGRKDDEDREATRNRFRLPHEHPDAIDVLLSSEVGCEGLDYEFCDRLVNYDIPWNPMRIEQRIGRIDRFGQASEKVLIFNFITPGTVEERIFFRCFERLGIFRDTVGDLEQVLGDVVQDLTQLAITPTLTAEQVEEKIQQLADNQIRLTEEQRRLEEENDALLAMDRSFFQDVHTLLVEGKFVAPDSLRQMITQFIGSADISGRILSEGTQPGLFRLRVSKDGRAKLLEQVKAQRRVDRPTIALTRWLEGNDPYLTITFDQKIALERRDVPFITPVHPLARIAIDHWSQSHESLTSHLLLFDDKVRAGEYLFVVDLWETLSIRPEVRIVCFGLDLDTRALVPEIVSSLLQLLERSEDLPDSIRHSPDVIRSGLEFLDGQAHEVQGEALAELQESNDALIRRKLASLTAYYKNRLRRVQTEIEHATEERIARMKESERDRIERDYESKKQEIERRRDADIITQRVAAGILEVRHGK